MGKLVCGCGNHQVVNPPTLCYPSCVEVDLWSDGFVPYPSFVRLILVALCLASKCRGCVIFEKGVVYSLLLYCPKSSLEVSLCGKSCVDKLVKILLCEGGDVELVLEPRNKSRCLRLIH